MIPLTIIGGYLGAGKTMLLNRLLREEHGRRLAVLVNDFGSINIDVELIVTQDGETVSLANGCICCTLSTGLLTTLTGLRDRSDPPEQIVIEASGIADPGKIARYAGLPGFRRAGVIVVADAERIERQWSDRYLSDTIQRQLQSADLLVLAKLDRLSDDAGDRVKAWVRRVLPEMPIIAANQPSLVSLLMLEGAGEHEITDQSLSLDEGDYRSWQFTTAESLDRVWFEDAVERLPESVLRAKGFARFREDPGRCWLLQWTGRNWSLEPVERPEMTGAQIVVIALTNHPDQFDPDAWFRNIQAAAERS